MFVIIWVFYSLFPLHFQLAMNVSRERYGPRTVFIFASDDSKWTNRHFGDLVDVFPTNKFYGLYRDAVALDLAAMTFCNHSIFRSKGQTLDPVCFFWGK